ncbi:MAG: protein kinase domain-containing protein [Pseudanabaenaceae cyanobacterium]
MDRKLARGGLASLAEVLDFLTDVLGILDFVHQQNVIHRDIKPSNLIRRKQDGKFVLIDFGAVKQIIRKGIMAIQALTGLKTPTLAKSTGRI